MPRTWILTKKNSDEENPQPSFQIPPSKPRHHHVVNQCDRNMRLLYYFTKAMFQSRGCSMTIAILRWADAVIKEMSSRPGRCAAHLLRHLMRQRECLINVWRSNTITVLSVVSNARGRTTCRCICVKNMESIKSFKLCFLVSTFCYLLNRKIKEKSLVVHFQKSS